MDTTLKADIDGDFSLIPSGYIQMSWNQGEISISTGGISVGYSGVLNIRNMFIDTFDSNSGNYLTMSIAKVTVTGEFRFDLNLYANTVTGVYFTSHKKATLFIKNFDIDTVNTYVGTLDASFTQLFLGASGFIDLNLGTNVNVRVDVDASVSIMGLNVVSPLQLMLSFQSDLTGAGELQFNTVSQKLRVKVYGSKPVRIDNFYFFTSYNGFIITALWDVLHIHLSGTGVVSIGSGEIKLDATLTSLEFTNAEIYFSNTGKSISIDGKITCSYGGELKINADTFANNLYIGINLNNGRVDINSFYIFFKNTCAIVLYADKGFAGLV